MSFDLLVKNANLPDGRTGIDIACQDGRIVAVEAGITADAAEVIDATAKLVSPPFVDSHFHMDATLSLGLPRMNQSGTLLEGIALWGELKGILTVDAVVERALKYCDLAVSQGLLAIRTHVDVCDDKLTGRSGSFGSAREGQGLHRSAASRFSARRSLPLPEC
jgi:cytosine deaminase